jgi:hypothetical protein
VLGVLVCLGLSSVSLAQPRPAAPPLVGATEVTKLTTPAGFIDDVVAGDGDRLAYVVADTASKAELHVVTLSTKAEQLVDLSGVTLHPIALQLVGPRAFVVGATEDGKQVAALVELGATRAKPAGTVVYKIAAATHITVVTRDGKPRIAVHRATSSAAGTRHEVELLALETGRRVGAARSLELGTGEVSKALEFRVNHWSDGWTRAHGIKSGEWDRKEDQRSPDTEATYDLVAGKLVDRTKIEDLFEQRRRFTALADAGGRLDFLRTGWDNKGLLAWRAGKPHAVELDQPLASYDLQSLQSVVLGDGSAWLALKVDPVNPEAVARQKADPEYLDVFRVTADGKAVRKVRILAQGVRHRFGVAGGDTFWLIERNQSMERGGKSLTVFRLN